MFALLKILQSLVKTLHSEGTPLQIGLGAALGAALGLTPLVNLHNLVVLTLLAVVNVSFGAGLLAWAVFVPVGFMLDPLFDRIGQQLLAAPALRPLFTAIDNSPGLALANLTNTVVLGSLVTWLVLFVPLCLVARALVIRYRRTFAERFANSPFYRTLKASQIYNVYRWFTP